MIDNTQYYKTYSFMINIETHKALKEYCHIHDTSMSRFVNAAIQKELNVLQDIETIDKEVEGIAFDSHVIDELDFDE